MADISIKGLNQFFGENQILHDITFDIFPGEKVAIVGPNGAGKTTLFRVITGELPYETGTISIAKNRTVGVIDQIPVYEPGDTVEQILRSAFHRIAEVRQRMTELEMQMEKNDDSQILKQYGALQAEFEAMGGYALDYEVDKVCNGLEIPKEMRAQPFDVLSGGEKTRVNLARIILEDTDILLLDEPTNHLDSEGRDAISAYLASKSGFILVSHDRALLDAVTDHTLSINRANIELQKGNFSSWMQNKQQQDEFEQARNRHLKSEIDKLGTAARRTAGWSDRIESSKIGAADKGYIGHKSAKMMQRAKSVEQRRQRAVEEKRKLLKNIETAEELKLHPIDYPKRFLAEAIDLSVSYGDKPLFSKLSFVIEPRERIALSGKNGSGKTSLIRLLLGEFVPHNGILRCGSNLKISYIPQDTSFLMGSLKELSQTAGIDESLFKAILRKLDFSREQFDKSMKDYSEGQKKKVLLAKSLCEQAHLYIWDEPLNYIDVFSRMQIEQLIIEYRPTLLFVEHDAYFENRIATKKIKL